MKETVRFKRPPIIILPAIHIIVSTMHEIVHTSLDSTSNALQFLNAGWKRVAEKGKRCYYSDSYDMVASIMRMCVY